MSQQIPNQSVIEQAGGIVLWGDRVVLRRTAKHNLVFPKGHVESGESLAQTAVREVEEEEETGLIADVLEYAGDIEIDDGAEVRRVTYFLMQVRYQTAEWLSHSGTDAFPMTFEWAESLLKHDEARALLRRLRPRLEDLARSAADVRPEPGVALIGGSLGVSSVGLERLLPYGL